MEYFEIHATALPPPDLVVLNDGSVESVSDTFIMITIKCFFSRIYIMSLLIFLRDNSIKFILINIKILPAWFDFKLESIPASVSRINCNLEYYLKLYHMK